MYAYTVFLLAIIHNVLAFRFGICNNYPLFGIQTRVRISKSSQRYVQIHSDKPLTSKLGESDVINTTFIEHGTMCTKKFVSWEPQLQIFKATNDTKFSWQHALHSQFFPSGRLTADYYTYAKWRAIQRLVSSTNSVFGTQALLLALGFKNKNLGTTFTTQSPLSDCI